jgi:hypothetical protein
VSLLAQENETQRPLSTWHEARTNCERALGFAVPVALARVSPAEPKNDQSNDGVHVADYAIPERRSL